MYILSLVVLLLANIDLFQSARRRSTCPADGADVILGANYGGTGGGSKVALDQGRIKGIRKWGLQDERANNYPWLDYAVVIEEWSSDSRTVSKPFEFGSVHLTHECTPFRLADDDYIIGYTAYYGSAYVYGLDFYTKSGLTYECHNDERIAGDGITATTEYYDCKGSSFYYLTGFDMRVGLIIDSIKAQWTRAPQECDCYETVLTDHYPDDAGGYCYEYEINAVSEFSTDPLCRNEIDYIELGDGNADTKCGLSEEDLATAVTRYYGPGSLEYTGKKVRNKEVRGYKVSGISVGDEFLICFDETMVDGIIKYGYIGYRPVRNAEYGCKVENTLFDLCPGYPLEEEEEVLVVDGEDVDYQPLYYRFGVNYMVWLCAAAVVLVVGVICYERCKRDEEKYRLMEGSDGYQYQSVSSV